MMKAEAVGSSTLTKNLPTSWRWGRLGEVCEFSYGSGLPSKVRQEGDIPVYGSNGIVGYHNQALTQGPTIIIGRKGSIGQVHLSQEPCWPIDTTYFIEHPKLDVDLKWLSYWLRALHLDELNKAAAIPGLNRDDAYALKISLPPLAEQQRIVAILNEQIATVQKAKDASEAELEAAKALLGATLRAVFESQEVKTWTKKRLGEVCEIQLGKMLSPVSKTGVRSRPYLRNANVQWGRFDLSTITQMDFTEAEEAKFALLPGDLLVCEGGEPGRAAVWDGQITPCYYQKALHRLRPINGAVDPHFVMYRLWIGALQGEFLESHAQTTIAHLPAVRLFELPIQIPQLAEQQRIVAHLSEQLEYVKRVSQALEEQLHTIQELPNILLNRAFNGEL